jgi:hypothetical protein
MHEGDIGGVSYSSGRMVEAKHVVISKLTPTTESNYAVHPTIAILLHFKPLAGFQMPRATSEKFSRLHQSAAKSSKTPSNLSLSGATRSKHTGKKDGYGGSGSTSNPLFNTERFGQHILKNPAVAQASVHPLKP